MSGSMVEVARRTHKGLPGKRGLYDPRNEHDACGIGFVANIGNRKSHRIVEQGLQILENLTHRGAVGADPLAGDGAGILIQMPDAHLRAVCGDIGIDLPPPGDYAVGMAFMPRAEGPARRLRGRGRRARRGGRPARAGLARRAGRQFGAGRERGPDRALPAPGLRRPRRGLRRRGRVRAQAVRDPQAGGAPDRRHGRGLRRLLHAVAVVAHRRLQGDAAGASGGGVLSRPQGRADGVRAGPRPPALLDQHLPVLAARPPLPDDLPQRRDQHAAGQHQLDGGAPPPDEVGAAGRRSGQAVAADRRGPVGFGELRQRARAAGAGRLFAGACDDDADPRGVDRQPADGRAPPRLLRVPRRADGAVGRPGRGGVHRRPPDRRDARPQRAAAGALRRHR